MITLLASTYRLLKFGGLGTFEQLKQGQEIEKLCAMAAWVKITQKVFP